MAILSSGWDGVVNRLWSVVGVCGAVWGIRAEAGR